MNERYPSLSEAMRDCRENASRLVDRPVIVDGQVATADEPFGGVLTSLRAAPRAVAQATQHYLVALFYVRRKRFWEYAGRIISKDDEFLTHTGRRARFFAKADLELGFYCIVGRVDPCVSLLEERAWDQIVGAQVPRSGAFLLLRRLTDVTALDLRDEAGQLVESIALPAHFSYFSRLDPCAVELTCQRVVRLIGPPRLRYARS